MTTTDRDSLTIWGERVALTAAVALTAKGEYDLAVLAHFAPWIAWLFPVMIDVYVITAFHKRRWVDVAVSFALMLFAQIAVHLIPVWITDGEQTPWGLVMAVACVAPIVVVRVKALTGPTRAEAQAEAEAEARAEETRKLRAALAEANRKQAETEQALRAEEHARKQAEQQVRVEAEEREAIRRELSSVRHAANHHSTELTAAEQRIHGLQNALAATREELESTRRAVARAEERAAIDRNRAPEIRRAPDRKSIGAQPAPLPVVDPETVPPVDGVKPEKVATVLAARAAMPDATQAEISAITGISDRTIRKVLNGLPVAVNGHQH